MQKNLMIKMAKQLSQIHKVYYMKGKQLILAKGNICLRQELGQFIDIIWEQSKGNMILHKSNNKIENSQTYYKGDNIEIFRGIQFRHAYKCPYQSVSQVIKSQKFYKPCACVLISNYTPQKKQKVLVTRRKLTLNSFPGAWVLPGGHLQQGQTVIQGGLRQAFQQIGLDISTACMGVNNHMMAWQSAFCVNNKIVSSNIVLFFPITTPTLFKPIPQQTQIQQFMWKDIRQESDQYKFKIQQKNGYGQAHLNYLSFYRNKVYGIQQKKLWILKLIQEENNIEKQFMQNNSTHAKNIQGNQANSKL